MIEAIKDFIFVELKQRELEERFRIESLSRDKNQTTAGMIIVLVTIVGFLGLDASLSQNDIIYPFWIPNRIIAAIVSLISIGVIHRQRSAKFVDLVTFVWVLIIIFHMLVINMTRLHDYVPVIIWDILTISGIYFVAPFPFQYKILAALLLTGSSGTIWVIYRIPLVDSYEAIAVLAAYFFTNVYGIFVSRLRDLSRRQHYVLLIKEMESRKELSARTIELEKTKEELKKLAMTDPLTGISNRRNFMLRASEELERTKRYNQPLSIMLLDIDNFKAINDTYGHEAGDEVLRSLTNHCLSNLRAIDKFARFGGDEFFALLVQTDQDKANEIAERLRESIERLEIHVDSETINTSVSIGLITTTGDELSVNELIKQADKALYKAKNRGRNQVVIV